MIKLKELIKEETIHSCECGGECGGDCCSTQLNESTNPYAPKGMQLGKIFTGHGFAFKKEEFELEESDLGLTYKKGKTVKVKHKKSGKELVIVDKPNVKREYEKIGYFAEWTESINEVKEIKKSDVVKLVKMAKKIDKELNILTKFYKSKIYNVNNNIVYKTWLSLDGARREYSIKAMSGIEYLEDHGWE